MKKNVISWFEIPVENFDRAKMFYETVLEIEIMVMPSMPDKSMKYGMFPFDMEGGGVGGGLSEMEGFEPSTKGSLVYLNGGDDLNHPLSKVEEAGGKILLPKTSIGENGFMAYFMDTEGNKVAFHSNK
jgi:predicted enzyme related to lactoylglutathione lyase